MIISFIGIPGSGKTTQISLLEKSTYMKEPISISIPALYKKREILSPYISSDDMRIIEDVEPESSAARDCGELAPFILDRIVFNLAVRLQKLGKTVILDGCPRGLAQAKLFIDILEQQGLLMYFKIVLLYFPLLPETCSQNRQIYRINYNGLLSDVDREKKIKKIPRKIKVYMDNTLPGVQYMLDAGVQHISVDATLSAEDIQEYILNFL